MATENIDNSIIAITRFMGFSCLIYVDTGNPVPPVRWARQRALRAAALLPDRGDVVAVSSTAAAWMQSGGWRVQRM
jgi:hypothetical protein